MTNFYLSEKKLYKPFSNDLENVNIANFFKKILTQDKDFLYLAAIYSIFISILSVALPVSVQLLINSVSFTGLLQPILVLGSILMLLLIFSAILNVLQFYVGEIFQQRFMARMALEVSQRLVEADYKAIEESNASELVNRFFEVTTIQKAVPKFLVKTLAFIFQTLIGLTIVAFYHPTLLLLSAIIAISFYLIVRLYFKRGAVSAFYESRRKYDIIGWLEDISRNIKIFKSEIGKNYCDFKTDFLTRQYLKERKNHFHVLMRQKILLLFLYVTANCAMLVVGGFLVLKGQLTIGQLVASELILSVILYEISQFARDIENVYDIIAALEKLSNFYNIPLDEKRRFKLDNQEQIDISLNEVEIEHLQKKYYFNLKFAAKKNYIIAAKAISSKQVLVDLINGFRLANKGFVEFNNKDISDVDLYNLRSQIATIDNADLIEGSVEEYLTFNNKNIDRKRINQVLQEVGFDKVLSRFEEGLQLRIIPSGWPFSETEKILLKTARIILFEPKIIIITEILDIVNFAMREKILQFLTKKHNATVLYFSNIRDGLEDFDQYIFIDENEAKIFNNIEELKKYEHQ